MTKYQDIAQMLDANAIQNIVDAYEKGKADERKKIMDIVDSAEDNAYAMFLLGRYFMTEQLKESKE